MKQLAWLLLMIGLLGAGYARAVKPAATGVLFEDDAAFLKQHTKVVILGPENGARVAVNPDLQGRVMTSTAGGPGSLSFGWMNRELLASGRNDPHMNTFGGEDRFWIGPEGGQFSVFFKAGSAFTLDNWFTPPPVNEGAFEVVAQEPKMLDGRPEPRTSIKFHKAIHLINYSGTAFDLDVARTVRLLDPLRLAALGVPEPRGLAWVGFESENGMTNAGSKPWVKKTGLLSIWILGQFNPSPETTIVVPFKLGPESTLGPYVNDAYFGKVPPDRLVVKPAEGVLFFKGDGKYRSKIGISPLRVKPFLGSYDAANRVLTIVHFTVPGDTTDYVNSMWQIQDKPFGGDAANSYNDGPASPGAKPLGPFYELESSSPSAALAPGQAITHTHTTMHFQGDEKALDAIAQALLGVTLGEIKSAFARTDKP